jgi:uncharacterized membrane protein (UPF0127 family)
MADRPVRELRSRLRWPAVVLLAVLLVAAGALTVDEFRTLGDPGEATVTVVDEDGTALGTVDVRIADTFEERYTGLSDTASLGPDEGMLFVHGDEGERTYVMRDMAFPIDIVFIGADRRITAIHHAEVEEPPLTRYRGRAKWVLEVPYGWTTDHGVTVGDRVRIDRASD